MGQRLVAALRPERIYLFGSRARGDADQDSDFDLLIVVPEVVGSPFLHPPSLPDVISFHCQQAAEKPLKAYLTWHNRGRFVHP